MNKLSIKKNLFIFLNVETNGLPTKNDHGSYHSHTESDKYDTSRIIKMNWAIYDYKQKQKVQRSFFIKPDNFEITNSHIHNITTDIATKQGIKIKKVFKTLKEDLENVKFVIAHNAPFHINILLSELYRYGYKSTLKEIQSKEEVCIGEKTRSLIKLPSNSSYNKYKMPNFEELYNFCFQKKPKDQLNVVNLADCFFYIIKN